MMSSHENVIYLFIYIIIYLFKLINFELDIFYNVARNISVISFQKNDNKQYED